MGRTVTIVGVDGVEWDLASGPLRADPEQSFAGGPPVKLSEHNRLGLPGSDPVAARHDVRDFVVPVTFLADGSGGLDELFEAFAGSVDPTVGACTIKVANGERAREIDAFLLDGFQGVGLQRCDSDVAQTVLSFRATYPYWRDSNAIEIVIDPPPTLWEAGEATFYDSAINYDAAIPYDGVQTSSINYDDPIPYDSAIPYDSSGASVLLMEITNPGQVWAWPQFDVRGGTSRVSAENLTLGRSWALPDGLGSGQTMVVTTRPGAASAKIDGVNSLGLFTDGVDLWGLPPKQTCLVALEIADRSENSFMRLSFTPEYLTS